MTRLGIRVERSGRQGRARRLGADTIARLDVVVSLAAVGVPAADALAIADGLASTGTWRVGEHLVLTYEPDRHRRDLARRLSDAAERVIRRPRGRPPAR